VQAAKHRPLKSFLIELAVNWVSHKHKMEVGGWLILLSAGWPSGKRGMMGCLD